MSTTKDGLKLLKATITNFKNIEYKEVILDGKSMLILGKNRQGKSALMQALTSPVNTSVIPIEPVRDGQDQGVTEIVIGGTINGIETSYTVGMVFSAGTQKGRLYLKDSTGKTVTSNQKGILDQIVGNISFDIMDFLRKGTTATGKRSEAGVKEQIEMLEGLVPKEDLAIIYKLKNEKQEAYNERHLINREITNLEGTVKSSTFTQDEIALYSTQMDVDSISKELEEANKHNENCHRIEKGVSEGEIEISQKKEEIQKLKEIIAEKESIIKGFEEKVTKGNDWLKNNKLIDTSEIQDKFKNISEHNSKFFQVEEIKKNIRVIEEKKEASKKLTDRIAQIEVEKKEAFQRAEMPVKGLEFDDEGITFNGLPLDEKQLPTSQLIGIGLRIGMALNPNLKLLTIKDGSLLDKETLDYVLKTCEEENYQVLIELVDSTKDGVELEFIEKGLK